MRVKFLLTIAISVVLSTVSFASVLDTSFGSGGSIATSVGSGNDLAQAVAVYPDGRIVAAGYGSNGVNNDFAVVRYLRNGTLDPTFGQGGVTLIPIGTSEDEAFACVIQPDGKLIAAGQTYDGIRTSFAAVRLNVDGTLDTSFGTGGRVVITPSIGNSIVRSVAISASGGLVLAGVGSNGSNFDIVLIGLKADGTLDNAFGTAGLVIKSVGSRNDQAYGVAVQTDGKIVVAGFYDTAVSTDTVLLRFLADGTPDPAFGANGVAIHALSSSDADEALSLALAPDGRIVVAGCIRNGAPNDFLVARFLTDGSLDTSFGGGGHAVVPFSSAPDLGLAVAVQPDGKIVAAGFGNNGSNNDFAVTRLDQNGFPDETFAAGGKTLTMIGPRADVANAVAIAPDGTIVAAGRTVSTTADFGVVRYRAGVAAITGRVVSPSGMPLRDARVSLIDAAGSVRIATTSSFGIFRFDDIPTMDGYTIAARSKRYRFTPSQINLAGNLAGVEILGLE